MIKTKQMWKEFLKEMIENVLRKEIKMNQM